jgi:SAM-dependent methyltransferase
MMSVTDHAILDEGMPFTPAKPVAHPLPDESVTRGPWVYTESDPALMLFTAAMSRFNLTFPPGSRILELGCAESDWLERMHRWDPSFELVGVDARRHARPQGSPCVPIIEGSAMNQDLFAPESFDRIVLLGALEHFGLGFYGDPEAAAGDVATMRNIARWLKPGGFVYFDVPCQPTYRVSDNRCFRSYAPIDVTTRLLRGWENGLQEVNRAYSLPEPHAGTWCHEPTEDRVPYWFVAVLAQKVSL